MKKWNLLKLLISIFLIFILVVFAVLCFLVGTYSGAKFTLDTVKDLVKDTVILDIDLKGGSFYRGLQTGKLYVEVKDIVKVSASSFDIAYDLTDVLVYKYLDVSKLKADDLDVVLLSSDKKEEPKIEEPLPEENNAPEKIAFPVTIQKCAEFVQPLFLFIGNASVPRAADAEQQIASAAKGITPSLAERLFFSFTDHIYPPSVYLRETFVPLGPQGRNALRGRVTPSAPLHARAGNGIYLPR